jgi:hypothetical protein
MRKLFDILICKGEFSKYEWIMGAVAFIVMFMIIILAGSLE